MYPTISMKQLELWIDEGREIQIVDLRNRPSYELCHFEGAVNIPFQEIESRKGELSKERPVVCYCSRGGQSMLACNYLGRCGFRVVNIGGGISAYQGKYMVWQ